MLHHPSASSPETNTRAIFLLAARQPPHAVYCNPFYDHAGHGSVFSTDPSTAQLSSNTQNYEYQPNSGIHGMVFDPTETYLYSADLRANKIWVHRKTPPSSSTTTTPPASASAPAGSAEASLVLVGSVDCPSPTDHPRWLAMHPSGSHLYALMEKGNILREYVVDPATHLPVYTRRAWPLIPPGLPEADKKTMYRADVCELSASGRYLFASSRANKSDLTGYISAFKLADSGDENGGGSIEKQLCLMPTPTSGGHSNAVSPCPWSDEWLAVTDDEQGWLDVYRWQDEFLARVARIRVQEPGFGMNAIWYD